MFPHTPSDDPKRYRVIVVLKFRNHPCALPIIWGGVGDLFLMLEFCLVKNNFSKINFFKMGWSIFGNGPPRPPQTTPIARPLAPRRTASRPVARACDPVARCASLPVSRLASRRTVKKLGLGGEMRSKKQVRFAVRPWSKTLGDGWQIGVRDASDGKRDGGRDGHAVRSFRVLRI